MKFLGVLCLSVPLLLSNSPTAVEVTPDGTFPNSDPDIGYDFSEADSYFAKRDVSEEGIKSIGKALIIYKESIPLVESQEDLVYAISQMSRLHLFLGDFTLAQSDHKNRMKIFDECIDINDNFLSPKKLGKSVANFYYYKAYCLALWGKAAGPLRSLIRVPVMKKTISEGMKIDTRYEGGGILRITAAVSLNEKAKPLGLYKPKEALVWTEAAISSPEIRDRAYANPISGADIIENYYHYSEALWKNKRQQDAVALLEDAITHFEELRDNNELPVGREPETLAYMPRLVDRLKH